MIRMHVGQQDGIDRLRIDAASCKVALNEPAVAANIARPVSNRDASFEWIRKVLTLVRRAGRKRVAED